MKLVKCLKSKLYVDSFWCFERSLLFPVFLKNLWWHYSISNCRLQLSFQIILTPFAFHQEFLHTHTDAERWWSERISHVKTFQIFSIAIWARMHLGKEHILLFWKWVAIMPLRWDKSTTQFHLTPLQAAKQISFIGFRRGWNEEQQADSSKPINSWAPDPGFPADTTSCWPGKYSILVCLFLWVIKQSN